MDLLSNQSCSQTQSICMKRRMPYHPYAHTQRRPIFDTPMRHMKIKILVLITTAVMMGSALAEGIIEYDGLIEPFSVVDIGAPAEGIVDHVSVDRSDMIEQGQILVELESSVEEVALEKARSVVTFDGDIKFQKTQLDFAKRVHNRVKTLSAVSSHDKDQAATDILLTRYRLKKAEENQILADYELRKAQAVMGRRIVRSPISGVVVDRYISPGEYVNSQPLLRVAQIDPLRVEVIVPAQMFGQIMPGMTAEIFPELQTYDLQTATVDIVDKVIDAASNTFGVRLLLPNKDQKMPGGLKCRVRFDMASAKTALQSQMKKQEETKKAKVIHRKNLIPKKGQIRLATTDEQLKPILCFPE